MYVANWQSGCLSGDKAVLHQMSFFFPGKLDFFESVMLCLFTILSKSAAVCGCSTVKHDN